jgi:hypothetical protein
MEESVQFVSLELKDTLVEGVNLREAITKLYEKGQRVGGQITIKQINKVFYLEGKFDMDNWRMIVKLCYNENDEDCSLQLHPVSIFYVNLCDGKCDFIDELYNAVMKKINAISFGLKCPCCSACLLRVGDTNPQI